MISLLKNKLLLKAAKIIFIIFMLCFLILVCFYIIREMGLGNKKVNQGKKVYEFVEDINSDGKTENIKFLNQYYTYESERATDLIHTSNHIKIYLDNKKMYSSDIITLGPLLNPKIVDLLEEKIYKKQIFVHDRGGGPAMPMDYYFYMKDGKFMVNKTQSSY